MPLQGQTGKSPSAVQSNPKDIMSDTHKNPKPTRILIVDDNQDIRKLLKLTFSYGNYDISEAQDGAQALAMIAQKRPDIILLDIMMPGEIDGLAVCEYVKSAALKNCWVILLSAKTHKEDFQKGLMAGADFYVTKPFSPTALIDIVEKIQLQ